MGINPIYDLVVEHIKAAAQDKCISSIVQLSGDSYVFLKKIQDSELMEHSYISFYVANSTPEEIYSADPCFKYAGSGFKTNRLNLSNGFSLMPPTIVFADFSFSKNTDELFELIENTKAVAAYVILPSHIEVDPNERALDKALRQATAKLIKIGEHGDQSAYLIILISSTAGNDSDPLGYTYMAYDHAWIGEDTAWGHSSDAGFINSLHITSKMNTVICHEGRLPLNHTPEQIVEKTKNLEEIQALYDSDRKEIESLFEEFSNLDPRILLMLDLKSCNVQHFYSKAIYNLDKDYWNSIKLLVEPQLKLGVIKSSYFSDKVEELFQEAIFPMYNRETKYASFSADTVKALSAQITSHINDSVSYAIDKLYFACRDPKSQQAYKTKDSYKYVLPRKIRTDSFLSFDTQVFEKHRAPLSLHDLHHITVPLKNICILSGAKDITLSVDDKSNYSPGSKIKVLGSFMGEEQSALLTLRLFKNGNQLMVFDDRLIRNINILVCKNNEWAKDAKDAFEEMRMKDGFDEFEHAYNKISAGGYKLEDTLLGDYI